MLRSPRRAQQDREDTELSPPDGSLQSRPCKRFVVLEQPEVILSWAADFPDTIKARKGVAVGPLQFALEAAYHKREKRLSYGCSCQDRLLGGSLRLHLPSNEIHYRKRFSLSNGTHVGITGGCNYAGFLHAGARLKPYMSVRYEMGQGAASLGQDSIGLRQCLPITRHLGVEFCGGLKLPLTSAEVTVEEGNGAFALGDGPCVFHVEQANILIDL